MSEFNDANGNVWTIDINYNSVKRLRSELQIDLMSIVDENSPLLKTLLSDEILLVDIISVLLTDQIKSRGMAADTFAQCLMGSGLQEALNALFQGIANFSRPQKGALIRKAWETAEDTETKVANRMIQELDKQTPQKKALAALETHLDQHLSE